MGTISCKNKLSQQVQIIIKTTDKPIYSNIPAGGKYVSPKIACCRKVIITDSLGKSLANDIICPPAKLILKNFGSGYQLIRKNSYADEKYNRRNISHITTNVLTFPGSTKYELTIKRNERISPVPTYHLCIQNIYTVQQWEIFCNKLNDLFWLYPAPLLLNCDEQTRIKKTEYLINEENKRLSTYNVQWTVKDYKLWSYNDGSSVYNYGWVFELFQFA